MTRTEDRIRDALTAWAELVPPDSVRPGYRQRDRRGPRAVVYVPAVAFAAAVIVLVAFVLTHLGTPMGQENEAPRSPDAVVPASSQSGRTPWAPAAPDPVRAGQFFATIENDHQFGTTSVVVRDATTGEITATVEVPTGVEQWSSLSGTAVPGLFYLVGEVVEDTPAPTSSAPISPTVESTLYRLTLDDAGGFAALEPVEPDEALPFSILYLAASPDGTRLAFPVDPDPTTPGWPIAQIEVVDLVAGSRETFRSEVTDVVDYLSWDAAGRYLGYRLGGDPPSYDGLWILDTSQPGDLLDRSRRVPGTLPEVLSGVVMDADATRFFLVVGQHDLAVVEVDAVTGTEREILRTTAAGQPRGEGWNILARSPVGTELLVVEPGGACYRIALATAARTDVPCGGSDSGTIAW